MRETGVRAKPLPMILCPRSEKKNFIEPLHACLDKLSHDQRLAVHLRFWEEMEIAQIADATGSTWVDVNHLIDGALLELRKKLAEHLTTDITASIVA